MAKLAKEHMTREQIDAELSKRFDSREAAEAQAKKLGPRWSVHEYPPRKGTFTLSHQLGWV